VKVDTDLERYLTEKGWKWKLVEGGRQVLVHDECPFCGKTKHLYFNAATTTWDCKVCGETGNLLTMKRRLGDLKLDVRPAYVFYRGPRGGPDLPGERPPEGVDIQFHRRLLDGVAPEVMEYLRDVRGFTEETIRTFKLGVAGKAGKPMLAIPHYYAGKLVCVKFRSVPPQPKAFMRWKDCPSVLFNGDCLKGMENLPAPERTVMVCEGETDAMALIQMGYPLVVASTSGAGRAEWPAHWLAPLEDATTILLVYDADPAGEEGAEKAATALGRYRCKRVRPPLHDAAQMVAAGLGREDVDQAISTARTYEDSVVKPTAAYCDDLRAALARQRPKGRATGWITLDAVWGGVRDGELTVVTGDTGSGKSTFTTAIARNQALQDVPVLIAPFEQHVHEVLGKLVSMDAKRSVYDMSREEVDVCLDRVLTMPLYFIDRHGPTPLGEIKDAIYLAVRRFGVRVVVLDHLHFFLDCPGEQERLAIDAAMRALMVWACDLDVHIFLVVHPKALGRDPKSGKTMRVQLNDLKGSSEIKKTASNGLGVHRLRQDSIGSRSDDVDIEVMKCRSPAGAEGTVRLHFEAGAERYLEGTRFPDRVDDDDDEPAGQWGMYNEPH
jgi:twinkle protein